MLKHLPKITNFFFLLTVFALPTYLWRFTLFSLPTNLLEILAIISILLFLLEKKYSTITLWQANLKPVVPALLLLFAGLLLSFFANGWNLSGLGIIKSWFVIPLIFALSLASIFNTPQRISMLLGTLYFSILSVALVALFYKASGILTYDQRLSAFYLSPNHLAMQLAPSFFLFSYFLSQEMKLFSKYLLYASLLPLALTFYFTFSYAAWLAVTLSFLLLFIIKTNKTKFFFAGILSVFIIFFIFQYDNPKLNDIFNKRSSLSSRIMIWRSSLKLIQDNPLLGIGPGNFQTNYLNYQVYFPPYLEWAVPEPHNLYLAFYLQTGVLGLIGFVLLCTHWLHFGLQQKNTSLALVFLGVLFYTLFHGLFDTPYWKNDLAYLFWIIFFLSGIFAKYSAKALKDRAL